MSNCIQVLFGTANFELYLNKKNRNRAKGFEMILHPAFGSDMIFNRRFSQIPKSRTKYSDKVIKDLSAAFDFVRDIRS
jgi:hypothetical protein